ncbi:MAG: hypothetical protein J1E83_08155 [Lachnospiraceae bacterium]|nr:hypothetical protein [Lachnospiraceae bacterium]
MLYTPIIQKIEYWRDYTGTGDLYRQNHDWDCLQANGNLLADNLVSLWLPLRYVLNHFGYAAWEAWKEYEYEELKPKNKGLKDCPAFLDELVADIENYLPPTELTLLLSELFRLGQQRCNVMILPYRRWNSQRGGRPYWEYLPHFLFDLLNTDSPLFLQALQTWIKREKLEMFFIDGKLDKDSLKDLAGTGAPWRHSPRKINLEKLLNNYIKILKERATQYDKEAS